MNWQHLRTFLWLKWRLRLNQMRRAGTGSMIIERIAFVLVGLFSLGAFTVFLVVGMFDIPTPTMMLVWDGLVAGFVLFWLTELMVELQRSELLSLDRFLHMPVPLTGVFLINYIGSIIAPSSIIFLSAAIGFAIGLMVSKGLLMLLVFPLIAAFTLAVTAITYQFRGWLASLMVNKRRRRAIITFATFVFVMMFQIPNFLGMGGGFGGGGRGNNGAFRRETGQLESRLAKKEIDRGEYERELDAIYKKYGRLRGADRKQAFDQNVEMVTSVNKVVPLGWLPYGARASAEGRALPALLGTVGLALVGAWSLRRSLNTTLRLYTGQFTSRKSRDATAEVKPAVAEESTSTRARPSAAFLETRLPVVSEHASVVAMAGLRSMLRAPETKLMLLSPLIMIGVFTSLFLRQGNFAPSEYVKPLMASGAVTMMLATMLQLAGNQFGFDRSGFRAFVLAPASRRDILLGKNLSLLPLALGMGILLVIFIEILVPMRVDHFLAAILQTISMYLLFCITTNFLSILAPTAVSSGSLKPAKPRGMTILIHILFFFLFPLALAPSLIPLGVEFLLRWAGWAPWFPAYLVLSAFELAGVVYVYSMVLGLQGKVLQSREQRILEIVTVKVE